jgi:UDP-2,3-diacylglucosamine hydrolase
MKKIGLIAGGGQFPLLFAQAAKVKEFQVYAVAWLKETDPKLDEFVDELCWLPLGQIKRLITFFKINEVNQVVMLGSIQKTRIFKDIRPDVLAIKAIAGLRNIQDDSLFRTFTSLLEKEGISVASSTEMVPELLAPEGCWTTRKPTRTEKLDIEAGWYAAKEIGRLDIGQCVVVGRRSILAVEAIDGTDATILRGGRLSNGKAVVVKVCKPNQDDRIDIPAAGVQTIDVMHQAGVNVLVIEAGRTVVFDREEMIQLANRYKISVVAMKDKNLGDI